MIRAHGQLSSLITSLINIVYDMNDVYHVIFIVVMHTQQAVEMDFPTDSLALSLNYPWVANTLLTPLHVQHTSSGSPCQFMFQDYTS